MPGTKVCRSCGGGFGGGNPCNYLFLREGEFLMRTSMTNLTRTSMNKKLAYKWFGLCKERWLNLNGQICVCGSCTSRILRDEDTGAAFLGYLTRTEHERYRADAIKATHLHEKGYVVLDRQDCIGCHFPTNMLLNAAYNNRGEIGKLNNGPISDCPERSWMSFKEGWEKKKELKDFWPEHQRRVSERVTRTAQPDIWFGRIAIGNKLELMKEGGLNMHMTEMAGRGREVASLDEPHFKIAGGQGLLWRGEGLDNDQYVHRDGGHNDGFNVVEPKTNGYKLKFFPKSHHLKGWTTEDPPDVGGYGETLTLREGQICLFYTTVLHAGSSSCGKADNFKKLEKQLKEIDAEKYEKIKWFGARTGKSSVGHVPWRIALTDLCVHWTIERVRGGSSQADHKTGRVGIFPCKEYESRIKRDDPRCYAKKNKFWGSTLEEKTKCEKYREARDKGFRYYKYIMTQPGNKEWDGPCGVHISDVNTSLNEFEMGRGEVQRKSGIKRSRVSYRE